MVNYGLSRGCETCKRRRKKCDETRPSCLRCTTAQRTCGGYDDDALRAFRQYDAFSSSTQDPACPGPFHSIARKCSLPVRIPSPTTGALPPDGLPTEVSDDRVEEFALRAFFYDYCIPSTNCGLSRGYLSGLEQMVQRLGWHCDLAKACKVVACATHGKKLRRPGLLRRADELGSELLGSLMGRIEKGDGAGREETVLVAVLLGLHEIIMADKGCPGQRNAHARGVAAILQMDVSPTDLFGAVQIVQSDHPLVFNRSTEQRGLFPNPYPKIGSPSLDALVLHFSYIWKAANAALHDLALSIRDLQRFIDDAQALDQAFTVWQDSQSPDFRPWNVGHVSQKPTPSTNELLGVGLWPARVDMYFDLSVAGVWNISRTARLLLIDLILKLFSKSDAINNANDNNNSNNNNNIHINRTTPDLSAITKYHDSALRLVQDMISSIPFHLAEDIQVFMRDASKPSSPQGSTPSAHSTTYLPVNADPLNPRSPSRRVGGLLLMHPLYIASNLEIVPQASRAYLRSCLDWIASYMRVGLAGVFAEADGIDEEGFADSCLIVWAGMLV